MGSLWRFSLRRSLYICIFSVMNASESLAVDRVNREREKNTTNIPDKEKPAQVIRPSLCLTLTLGTCFCAFNCSTNLS